MKRQPMTVNQLLFFKKKKERKETYPFDPKSTNIPDIGMSRLRSSTALTQRLDPGTEDLYILLRLRMDIAVLDLDG